MNESQPNTESGRVGDTPAPWHVAIGTKRADDSLRREITKLTKRHVHLRSRVNAWGDNPPLTAWPSWSLRKRLLGMLEQMEERLRR